MKNEAVISEQPRPTPGKEIVQNKLFAYAGVTSPNWPVVQDILLRGEMGKEKYGSYLMTYNGRSADLDLYQELCDAVIYAAQGWLEEADPLISYERQADILYLLKIARHYRVRLVKKGILDE